MPFFLLEVDSRILLQDICVLFFHFFAEFGFVGERAKWVNFLKRLRCSGSAARIEGVLAEG